MQKRGNVKQYFVMFELLIVAIVVLGMLMFAKGTVDGSDLEKEYLARDIGLIVTTLYAAPGDVVYTYYPGKNNFDFSFSKGSVVVSQKGMRPATYTYSADSSYAPLEGTFAQPKQLTFIKKGNELKVEAS